MVQEEIPLVYKAKICLCSLYTFRVQISRSNYGRVLQPKMVQIECLTATNKKDARDCGA